jgi:hypothetical protein
MAGFPIGEHTELIFLFGEGEPSGDGGPGMSGSARAPMEQALNKATEGSIKGITFSGAPTG